MQMNGNLLSNILVKEIFHVKLIATKDDRVCPPEMVEKITCKYNADFKVYDGCHHIFANWKDIADGIQIFMTKLWLM